jgi:hypothetical protein
MAVVHRFPPPGRTSFQTDPFPILYHSPKIHPET